MTDQTEVHEKAGPIIAELENARPRRLFQQHGGPKSKPPPSYQNIVLNRIKACQ